MRVLLASPLGLLIGASLGALGGGGSILAVPALVHGAGQSAQAATTTSLLLVAVASVIGLAPHWRSGNVRLRAGLAFGAAGIGGSLVGTTLNRQVDGDLLLVAFGVLMFVAAAAMLRRARARVAATVGADGLPGDGTDGPTELGRPADVDTSQRVPVLGVLATGTAVGALTGFFGVGGGFVIVPALVVVLGFEMNEAVGTSLVVIAVNALMALGLRSGGATIDWAVAVPFVVAAAIGTVVGARIGQRYDSAVLTRWFAIGLVIVAIHTTATAVIGLLS